MARGSRWRLKRVRHDAAHRDHADPQHHAANARPLIGMKRWLELYAKHATAWDAWMREQGRSEEGRPWRGIVALKS